MKTMIERKYNFTLGILFCKQEWLVDTFVHVLLYVFTSYIS